MYVNASVPTILTYYPNDKKEWCCHVADVVANP